MQLRPYLPNIRFAVQALLLHSRQLIQQILIQLFQISFLFSNLLLQDEQLSVLVNVVFAYAYGSETYGMI